MSAWLSAIAINECRSYRRRLFRRQKHFDSADGAQFVRDERKAMDRETFDIVRRSVVALPALYREVVVLRYLEEMPIEQMCAVLGVGRNVVQVRLHRAREQLKGPLQGLR